MKSNKINRSASASADLKRVRSTPGNLKSKKPVKENSKQIAVIKRSLSSSGIKEKSKKKTKAIAKDDFDDDFASVPATYTLGSEKTFPEENWEINSENLSELIESMTQQNRLIQLQTVYKLTRITTGSLDIIKKAVSAGAIPLLLQLIHSFEEAVREKALWALANIAQSGPHLRDLLITQGVVERVLLLLELDLCKLDLYSVARLLKNLCMHKDFSPPVATIKQIMNASHKLIKCSDPIVLFETTYIIRGLARSGTSNIRILTDSGIIPKLIPLLGHADVQLKLATLRAVREMLNKSDEALQTFLDYNLLLYITEIFTLDIEELRTVAISIADNIFARSASEI